MTKSATLCDNLADFVELFATSHIIRGMLLKK